MTITDALHHERIRAWLATTLSDAGLTAAEFLQDDSRVLSAVERAYDKIPLIPFRAAISATIGKEGFGRFVLALRDRMVASNRLQPSALSVDDVKAALKSIGGDAHAGDTPVPTVEWRVCARCGTDNLPHAKYCKGCGTNLDSAPVAAPPQPDENECPSCHAHNGPKARFCGRCGTKLPEPEPAAVVTGTSGDRGYGAPPHGDEGDADRERHTAVASEVTIPPLPVDPVPPAAPETGPQAPPDSLAPAAIAVPLSDITADSSVKPWKLWLGAAFVVAALIALVLYLLQLQGQRSIPEAPRVEPAAPAPPVPPAAPALMPAPPPAVPAPEPVPSAPIAAPEPLAPNERPVPPPPARAPETRKPPPVPPPRERPPEVAPVSGPESAVRAPPPAAESTDGAPVLTGAQRLRQAQEQCSKAGGFFAREACKERIRWDHCHPDKWNVAPECKVERDPAGRPP